MDYPYFKELFFKNALGKAEIRPYIRIITLNDSSREEILRNLRQMNDGIISLRGHSDFDFFRDG